MFERLAARVSAHPRTLLIWVGIAFVFSIAFGASVANRFSTSDPFLVSSSESAIGEQHFEDFTGSHAYPTAVVLIQTPTGARSLEGLRRVREVTRIAKKTAGVKRVVDVRDADDALEKDRKVGWTAEPTAFVSRDGRLTYTLVYSTPETVGSDLAKDLEKRLSAQKAWITIGGPGVLGQSIQDQVSKDLGRVELLAFPFLLLGALLVFRGLVAMLLPLFVGGLTLAGSLALLRLTNGVIPLSVFALNLSLMLGLGLGIDYSLFVTSRFRAPSTFH